ncbi:CHAT domain-containing protein [Lasiosphaeria hispida]|uniref:CHAT domain-containing protein n=1 Tax=Lasiosphaeria hispida TaxID=260671 RepID=A0AAJ0HJT4_9PEZI|nr:CHAT domain-containing protein [Lasiosphaeria hispida]
MSSSSQEPGLADPSVLAEFLAQVSQRAVALVETGDLLNLNLAIDSLTQAISLARSVNLYPITMVFNLMNMLSMRYRRTGSVADVELGISRGNTALRLIRHDDPNYRQLCGCLGMLYLLQFNCMKTPEGLQKSIEYTTTAVDTSPRGDPGLHDLRFNLGKALYARYTQTNDLADLDLSIQAHDAAIELAPVGHPLRGVRMTSLSDCLLAKFDRTHDKAVLARSISIMGRALQITPHGDESRPRMVYDLGVCLGRHFEIAGTVGGYEKDESFERAERLAGPSREERATILHQIAQGLYRRYEARHDLADRDRAIVVAEEALLLTPNDPGVLNNLGAFFGHRFEETGEPSDLDRAIALLTKGCKVSPLNGSADATVLHNLALNLAERFEHGGILGDLDLAIAATQDALDKLAKDDPKRFRTMINQAVFLDLRFEHSSQKGEPRRAEDLGQALRLSKQVLLEAPAGHPSRHIWLEIRGNMLGRHFSAYGDGGSLDDAIRSTGEAIDMLSRTGEPGSSTWSNYGEWLGHRFLRKGDIQDLNKAIEAVHRAVKTTSKSHLRMAHWQRNLGVWLAHRYERVGALEDLNRAIEAGQIAVDSTPAGNIELPARLNILSTCYSLRYQRKNNIDDLNSSMDLARTAVNKTPDGHPRKPYWILNLATRLEIRGTRSGDDARGTYLDEAIRHFDDALRLLPESAHAKLDAQVKFGSTLRHRFVLSGQQSNHTGDINRSIEMLRKAASGVTQEDSLRVTAFFNLGVSLMCRSDLTESSLPTDALDALDSFVETFRSPNSPPSHRIRGSQRAAIILDSLSRSREAAEILEEAINLFSALSPRSLPRLDQQHVLGVIVGISSMAAAMALKSGYDHYSVIMLLERGRGIIASLLMENRMDTSMLGSEVASNYLQARERLYPEKPINYMASSGLYDEQPHSNYVSESLGRFEAEDRLHTIIREIQADPKTRGFLQPPPLEELTGALGLDTIVIVNASPYRCDAFVINEAQGVGLVELTRLKFGDIRARVERLRSSRPLIDPTMLEWLWDDIANPILSKLGFDQPGPAKGLPRIIWVLSGALSRLPIHAAGYHTKGSTKTVMDRAISSYSSSLRSFMYAKKVPSRAAGTLQGSLAKKALLVGVGKAPEGSRLPDLAFAAKEVEMLQEICPQLNLEPVRISCQSREAVLAELDALVFHFAGHGQSDALDPSQGGLHLEDGLLTVADIEARKLGDANPFLGYLSACLTGANDADTLIDEGIHLISACQLAGFRHVIGTLWQVYDDSCVEVAESVYRLLAEDGLSDRSVCAALHRAIVRLRDAWVAERSSVAAFDGTKPDEALSVELADGDTLEANAAGDNGDERDGRLLHGEAIAAPVVKADWIPYVHYGP